MGKFKQRIRFFYIKWIKRRCPHFCATCQYKKRECYEDYLNNNF